MNYIYPEMGARYNGNGSCTFTVWAPLKETVELLLHSSNKTYPLQKDERGCWSITLNDISPGARYSFKLDGEKILPDPASKSQPDGVHKPSAVVDPSFKWTDQQWKGLPMKDMIIYELHVGTFSSKHNFAGVVEKLPYLKELGINAIEIMPIAQFPGERNWGYDGVYPFAAQHSYGGPEGLKHLVNEAHRHGIAVILDVVYNHQGPEGNYFGEFAPFFSDKYKTFWGSAINFDNAHCDGVRNFYWQNALMWLDEYRIDGLRMDAVHAIWDFSANHFIEELVRKVRQLEAKTGCEKVLIAELDLNHPRYISDPQRGGYGMNGQWIDEFHHALHALITGETDGYYEDFGTAEHLVKSIRDSYVYTGEYSIHRKRHFGVAPEHNSYSQFVIFSQNHDQVGNRLLGDRLTNHLSLEGLKLAAAAVLLSPQVPMLFMGEEYGEKNPFQYFISHTDKELVEMVRKGRKEEFSYFNWKEEVPDPQSEETFNKCILSFAYDDPYNKMLFNFYKHLIQLRKTRAAFKGDSKDSVIVFEPQQKVIAFVRMFESDTVLIVLNFDNAPAPFVVPAELKKVSFRKMLDSSAIEWGGPGELAAATLSPPDNIILQPQSVLLFALN